MTKDNRTEMGRSYLVQRLKNPPTSSRQAAIAEAFAFGGGYRNGGLSDEAMSALRQVFRFDYMGAAEFEFGAVPEALAGLARDHKRLVAYAVQVPLSTVPPNWRVKDKTPPEGEATVYVLARAQQAAEVTSRILAFATGEGGTKESVRLAAALRPHLEWDSEVQGWLELDNGYFFFVSAEMWAATAALFGVPTAVPAASA